MIWGTKERYGLAFDRCPETKDVVWEVRAAVTPGFFPPSPAAAAAKEQGIKHTFGWTT